MTLTDALNWVLTEIIHTVNFLGQWEFLGISFLYWLIGYTVMAISLRFIFG